MDAALCDAFRAVSGDVNSVHAVSDRVHRSLGGRPVAFGALGVLAALELSARAGLEVEGITVNFLRPVIVGETLRMTWADGGVGPARTIHGRVGDRLCLTARVATEPGDVHKRRGPAATVPPGSEWFERPSLPEHGLIRDTFSSVPPDLVDAMADVSWFAGVVEPGDGSIVGSVRLERSDRRPSLRGIRRDRRRGLLNGRILEISGSVHDGRGNAFDATFSSIPFRDVPECDESWLRDELVDVEGSLDGRRVLVLGGARGLGRAVTVGLAALGATVDVVYRSSERDAATLRALDLPGKITPVRADAGDPGAVLRALAPAEGDVPRYAGAFCGVSAGIRPGASAEDADISDLVGGAVSVAWTMIEAAAGLVVPGGWLCYVSSPVVEGCTADWMAYGVEKSAGEWILAQVAARRGTVPMIVRPPMLETEFAAMVDPFGARARVEPVAAAIVRHIARGDHGADSPALVDLDLQVGRKVVAP